MSGPLFVGKNWTRGPLFTRDHISRDKALHIYKHTNLMKRDGGIEVSHSWDSPSTVHLHCSHTFLSLLYTFLFIYLVVLSLSLRKASVWRPKRWIICFQHSGMQEYINSQTLKSNTSAICIRIPCMPPLPLACKP